MEKLSNTMLFSYVREKKAKNVEDDKMSFVLKFFTEFIVVNSEDISLTSKEVDEIILVTCNVLGKGSGSDETYELIEFVVWVFDEAERSKFVKAFLGFVLDKKFTKIVFKSLFKAVVSYQNIYPNLASEDPNMKNIEAFMDFVINCNLPTEGSIMKAFEVKF